MKGRMSNLVNDFLQHLSSLCKSIAYKEYDGDRMDELFELIQNGEHPTLLRELADSFGMMVVRFEAKEFQLEQTIEKLGKVKTALEEYSQTLELKVTERTAALQKANEELGRLANLDGLTQIPNRRRLNEHLEQEWKRLQRERSPLSMILCDVDFFKKYNDHYGHQAGDDCLRAIARVVNSQAKRPADLAARYGGEEFVIVLPNTDAKGALNVAKTLLKNVRNLKIPHATSTVHKHVTLSMGISSMTPCPELSVEALLAASDRALYEAKEQGRNRIVQVL